jgi:hypothetical protein
MEVKTRYEPISRNHTSALHFGEREGPRFLWVAWGRLCFPLPPSPTPGFQPHVPSCLRCQLTSRGCRRGLCAALSGANEVSAGGNLIVKRCRLLLGQLNRLSGVAPSRYLSEIQSFRALRTPLGAFNASEKRMSGMLGLRPDWLCQLRCPGPDRPRSRHLLLHRK